MIYRRHIVSSLNANSFTVFIILLAITLSVIAVRVLDKAAWGQIDDSFVLVYLLLSFFSSSPYLVQMTAIMGILQTFQKIYAESAMVIWEGAGMPLYRWIKYVGLWLLGLMLLVAVLVFFLRPWSIGISRQLDDQFRQSQSLVKNSAGVFNSSNNGRTVLYFESKITDSDKLENMFLYRQLPVSASKLNTPAPIQFALAKRGSILGTQNSLLQFDDGDFYGITFEPLNVNIIHFNKMQLDTLNPYQSPSTKIRAQTTVKLFKSKDLGAKAELYWRFSMVLQTWIMGLFALAFSYSAPRKRSYMSFIIILAFGMIYYNLTSVMQNLIINRQLPIWLLFTTLHGSFFSLGLILVLSRSYHFSWHRAIKKLIPHG